MNRIKREESSTERPGHRTRWPGHHCAGSEATPQPRPPSWHSLRASLSLSLSTRPRLALALLRRVSLSLAFPSLCNALSTNPRRAYPATPTRYPRELFPSRSHPRASARIWKKEPSRRRVSTSLSLPLSFSLSLSSPPSLRSLILAVCTHLSFGVQMRSAL